MTAIPSPRQTGSDTSSWRSTIDGLAREKDVRRDLLILVAMLLTTVIVIALIIFYIALITFRAGDSVLAPVLSTTTGKIVTGSTAVTTIAGISWRARLRQRHRRHLKAIDQRCRVRQTRIPAETPQRTDRAK